MKSKNHVYRCYPDAYFSLLVNPWLPHQILAETEEQIIINREPDYDLLETLPVNFVRPKQGTVRLHRKDLFDDAVSLKIDGYYSLKEHMAFFSSQGLFTQKQYDDFRSDLEGKFDDYLCAVFEDRAEYTRGAEPALMLFSFLWLETEAGGIWRWENKWKLSIKNLLKDRQMIYDRFAHELEERDFPSEEEGDRWSRADFFGRNKADKDYHKKEEHEEVIGGFSWEIMDALTALGLKNSLRGLTLDRIKSIYRRLAKRHHPDAKDTDKSEGKIKEINSGYHTLKNLFKNAV